MNHLSGLRSLASATLSILGLHWDPFWISRCSLVSWESCSFGSTVLALLHTLALHRRNGSWGELTSALDLGWSVCQFSFIVITKASFLHCPSSLEQEILTPTPSIMWSMGEGELPPPLDTQGRQEENGSCPSPAAAYKTTDRVPFLGST